MAAAVDWVLIHDRAGFFLVVALVAGALLALIALVTPLVGTILKLYLRLLLLVVALQVVLGGVLYVTGHRPAHELHYLYGAGVVVTLGLTLAVSRRTPWPVSKLPLIAGAIVACGFAVLALTTG